MSHDHNHPHDDEIDCTIAIEQLYAYLDKELTDATEIRQFEEHVSHCKSCFSRMELEKEITRRLAIKKEKEIPDTLKSRLDNILDNL